MLSSRIIGTGSFAPKKVLTNHDLEAMVDTTDEWIFSRTGIRERRLSAGCTTAEMAVKAARSALKAAGVLAKDIDLVVVGTVTADMTFPSTACLIQSSLGIKSGTPAFDVSAACSGFLYALDAADRYIVAGGVKKALVVGVDRFSGIIDWKDRGTCVLFGDGAGAVVLRAEKGSRRGILSSRIHSDGRLWETLYAPSAIPQGPFGKKKGEASPYLRMNGNETFKVAVRTMTTAITETLAKSGLRKEDISLLVPHQANIRIMNAIKERMGLADGKLFSNIDRYGNTSAGSIPLALDEAVRAGMVKDNDIIVFVAFGGGLTWASAVVRW
ncbi:MAG: ketoacyl-ACP synthase III [Deltaproteobacteria bacterium]|nr:ketoacyl-ACP synthase III [Deltaproteobacteria bacterium]